MLGETPVQRRFDDLGTALSEVTFCVVDLETTGGSPAGDAITEIGAVKLRGGECLGTLQTLVNPGTGIPPAIVVLTGITDAMVAPAPPISEVLPSFLEFAAGTVIVGHNVRFDLGFLEKALAATGRPRLGNRFVDTCALARRLVRDEVGDCRLSTLARYLRLSHQPCHRALDDALATGELLHVLLERAAGLGVLGLDDLLALPTIHAHPQASKLKLTTGLPRRPGVYLFRGARGKVLYVGKASNLRTRVRSYFSTDDRRKVSSLLRETERIDHIECAGPLEAAVLEVRLIHHHEPPFNRRGKSWRKYAYLKLTLNERFPRLSIVRSASSADGCLYVGPLPSAAAARQVAEAIESAVPIRRCTSKPPKAPRDGSCTAAQLGVATCPCAGEITEDAYRQLVDTVVRGLTVDPGALLEPLAARMTALAAAQRFEEAAATRDRADALARVLVRQRQIESLLRAGRLELHVARQSPDDRAGGKSRTVILSNGRVLSQPAGLGLDGPGPAGAPVPPGGPLPRHLVDELACVVAWLDTHHGAVLSRCDGEWSSPLPPLPRFEPGRRRVQIRPAAS